MLAELLHVVRARRLRSLYDGLGPSLIGTAASQGVYFYLYELIKRALVKRAPGSREGQIPGEMVMVSFLVNREDCPRRYIQCPINSRDHAANRCITLPSTVDLKSPYLQ